MNIPGELSQKIPIPGNALSLMKKTYLLFDFLHDILAERTFSVHSALQSGDSAKNFRAKQNT